MELVLEGLGILGTTARDVLPIAAFLFLFRWLVIGGAMPDGGKILVGFLLVVAGLGCFLVGLEEALFPLGRLMATQLTAPSFLGTEGMAPELIHWTKYYWVYLFGIAIGFSTTLAEPSLLAVAIKASEVSGGAISPWGLRIAVAIGVAVGVGLGCVRIVTGTPLHYYIMAGYVVVVIQTLFAPRMLIPLAYDSGGVTTSTVTVPLVAALGLGLAEVVPGRSPLLDGFGLIAFASLFPIMAVLGYAQLTVWLAQHAGTADAGKGSPAQAKR